MWLCYKVDVVLLKGWRAFLHGGKVKSTPSPRPKTGVWQLEYCRTKIANCEKEFKFEYKQIIDQLLIRWKKHLIWKWISIPYKIANLNICTSFQHQYHPIIELLWYYRLVLPNYLFSTPPYLLIFCVKFSVLFVLLTVFKENLAKKILYVLFFYRQVLQEKYNSFIWNSVNLWFLHDYQHFI